MLPYLEGEHFGKFGEFTSNRQIFTLQNILVDEICKPRNFSFLLIIIMFGMLTYFHHTNNSSHKDSDKEESSLPDPNGELSKKIPSSSITVANAMVNKILEKPRGKCGSYLTLTPAQFVIMPRRFQIFF